MMKSVRKFIILIYLIASFTSSEIIAQNLNLTITGSNIEESKIISDFGYKTNHIDYNSIIKEADSIEQRIIKSGYIETERSILTKTNDSTFKIQFQLKNKYESIGISYDSSKIKKSIINSVSEESFKNYFTIPLYNLEETLQLINVKIASDGFPFSKIRLSTIKIKNESTLTARLIVSEKKRKRSLDNIVIKGYEKFPKSYLKRFLKIKPEKVFNLEEIKENMNTLSNLRFAEQTKAPEVLFSKDSTSLYIYLKKSQSNTFDGFLGFSTNEGTNRIDFNGFINLELNNNLNYGETFRLIYKSDESEQRNFEAELSMPYLFSSPIGTELSLKILRRDSSFTSINQKANVFYQLNPKNRIFIGVESTESNNLLNNEINFEIEDYKSNRYNLKYAFENRQNFNSLFQIKSKVDIELGFGERETNTVVENQEQINLDAFHSFHLNKKNSLYTRLNIAVINSETYLKNELFRFGGINSIRGFLENSILASRYLVVNTEYRYQLSKSIYAHTILDFADFENKISNTKNNLYGFGLGFGILTKAGLLKFNFANGKSETQNFKFSNSKIHLSLVSIF